jgi:hypothetical protein
MSTALITWDAYIVIFKVEGIYCTPIEDLAYGMAVAYRKGVHNIDEFEAPASTGRNTDDRHVKSCPSYMFKGKLLFWGSANTYYD